MSMNQTQIDTISRFIHSRGFKTIEVEMEILDHMASAVEQQLAKKPDMDINKAITAAHRSFGPLGFSVLEDSIAHSLSQRIWHTFISKLREQFSTAQVFVNLATALLLFLVLNSFKFIVSADFLNIAIITTVALIAFIPLIYHRKAFKKWKKNSMLTGKLLIPFALSTGWIAYALQLIPGELWATNDIAFGWGMMALSLLVSSYLWASTRLISETYDWTYQQWIKYQPS